MLRRLFGDVDGSKSVRYLDDRNIASSDSRLVGDRADEVARTAEHLKGNLTLALESTFNRMSRLARNHIVHGRQISTEEVEAAFDAVDVAAVDALAQELLGPAQRGLCVLGPAEIRNVRLPGAAAA